jgi:phosphatidate cytidylyltransferase
MTTAERLWGPQYAFDHPVALWIAVGVAGALLLGMLLVLLLGRAGRVHEATLTELRRRIVSWAVIAPMLIVPILLGAGPTIAIFVLVSVWCYREYARATGLFRERLVSALVVVGILAVHFAALDHWYGLFAALWPLSVAVIAALAVLQDRPAGYIQRVGLGVFAFALFGGGLGHLSYFANDADYRAILLWLLLAVELNDVLAYVWGRTIGGRKLMPTTSPGKTIAGSVGALISTTLIAAVVGHFVFRGTAVDHPVHLLLLGAIISVAGQLGDLMLSSIKRDIGVKDMAATIPGHGGLLDRFDSMLLVAPCVFHYIRYLIDIGATQTPRIITG